MDPVDQISFLRMRFQRPHFFYEKIFSGKKDLFSDVKILHFILHKSGGDLLKNGAGVFPLRRLEFWGFWKATLKTNLRCVYFSCILIVDKSPKSIDL